MKRDDQKIQPLLCFFAGLGSFWVTASLAAEIPLAGAYGTPLTCALYLAGGGRAVFKDTMPPGIDHPPISSEAADEPYLLVTPKMYLSYEAACEVHSVAGEKVTFRCSGEHTGDHDFVATLVEDEAGKTLSYEDAYERYVLQRCLPLPVS